jgi:dienelactone hydrolase
MDKRRTKVTILGFISIFVIAAWLLGSVTDAMAVRGGEVLYKANGVVLKGYLAYDDAVAGKRPGVLVVHDWWGISEFVRDRARELAKLGYTALAVDMYGEGKEATDPKEASKLAGEVRKNPSMMKARFDAARGVLSKHRSVDSKRLAAIGYSLGGSIVMEMARQGSDLAGVVVFWGSLKTERPAQKGIVKARVLALEGMEDPSVSVEQVKQFKAEMDAAGVHYKVIVYPNSKHAFSRHDADSLARKFNLPQLAYNAEADQKSWAEMEAFLKMLFRK